SISACRPSRARGYHARLDHAAGRPVLARVSPCSRSRHVSRAVQAAPAGGGPKILNPVRTLDDLRRVRACDLDELSFVYDTVRLVRKQLPGDIPLLGFAGAPFTLASYAIEGGGSRDFARTKRIMYACPGLWSALLERLADSIVGYLERQIEAG